MFTKRMTVLLLFLLGQGAALAAPSVDAVRARHLAEVARIDGVNRAQYGDKADYLVLPGLLADRAGKRITFHAEATKVASHDPIEFFLLGTQSGNDYEALAVALVRPGDIWKALCFIGMQPGQSVSRSEMRFWPKGERVMVKLTWEHEGRTNSAPLEQLLFDTESKTPLPAAGLVFTGSRLVDAPQVADAGASNVAQVVAADVYDPFSIASGYNEPASILDVPRQASQGDVYERQIPNADLRLPPDALILVVMEPEYKDGRQRVKDVELHARAAAEGGEGLGLGAVECTLDVPDRNPEPRVHGINAVLTELQTLVEAGYDPYLGLDLSGELRLGAIRELCLLLGSIEGPNGIRMEPPREGQLYYKAFMPPEAFRERDKRVAQPWELRLEPREQGLKAILVDIAETWVEEATRPQLTVTEIALADASALRREIESRPAKLPVLLVYAAPTVTYAQLMEYVGPLRATHPLVHIFLRD